MPASCLDKHIVPHFKAPSKPKWDKYDVGVEADEHGPVPVVSVKWKLQSDGEKRKNLVLLLALH